VLETIKPSLIQQSYLKTMDLQQRKLNRTEWNSIEIAVPKAEIDVLHLIMKGYYDVNIRINHSNSIFTFLKIEYTEKMEDYLYNKYLKERVDKIEAILKKVDFGYKPMKVNGDAKINSADRIRLERFDESDLMENDIYEFVLLSHMEKLLQYRIAKDVKNAHYHYYTLYKLSKNSVARLNRYIPIVCHRIFEIFGETTSMMTIIENSVEFIEKNDSLLRYTDLMLYTHQKDIFTLCKNRMPKLILYMAPTGTGKTLTPIALSEQKKVIFVCAARHVGLALARAAISVKKKIAFAFGCSSADDIRLHYFAAKEFTKNKRSGGIGKVDNSVGDNVEIMICDIRSYLPAMYYMLAFFPPEDIVFYWDEPTITLDYEDHEFHKTIQANWRDNKIPNIVLSSATLPKENELTETLPDFLNKFPGGKVFNIVSHDCKKSIPIINNDGYVVLPHYLERNYERTVEIAEHCSQYLTLMRYFDLKEVVEFICYVTEKQYGNWKCTLDRYIETIDDINMQNIKLYYLFALKNIQPDKWAELYDHFIATRQPRIFENASVPGGLQGAPLRKIVSEQCVASHNVGSASENASLGKPLRKIISEQSVHVHATSAAAKSAQKKGTSGVYVTTKDAYTLTDGPTIFISDDIEKIAKFCIQQANIPGVVMDEIMKKIEYNNVINARLFELESEVEHIKDAADRKARNEVSGSHGTMKISGRNKSNKDLKKLSRDLPAEMENKGGLSKLTQEINQLRSMIKSATLNDAFVPNKKMHLNKWAPDARKAFTSNVDDQTVSDIMALKGVENSWKILLMMGIGVFINHENISYTEIMKRLADEQKLYMIIASSDYIYGTNYQFCHGFLSKDLNLTQEKVIQAMGRIGRNNIQQTYTVRFRDDTQILKLFTSATDKPEIRNINRLFHSITREAEEDVYNSDDVELHSNSSSELSEMNDSTDTSD